MVPPGEVAMGLLHHFLMGVALGQPPTSSPIESTWIEAKPKKYCTKISLVKILLGEFGV